MDSLGPRLGILYTAQGLQRTTLHNQGIATNLHRIQTSSLQRLGKGDTVLANFKDIYLSYWIFSLPMFPFTLL